GGADPLAKRKPHSLGRRLAGAGPGGPRLLALARHRRVEALDIDADAARLERVLGEIEGKAIGVVERERGVAGEIFAGLERAGLGVEDRKTALEGAAEAGLLE